MPAHRITVTIDDDRLDRIEAIVEHLRARGMTVEQVLPALGIVTGTIGDLAALDGVAGIQPPVLDESVQLPPPGSDVQ